MRVAVIFRSRRVYSGCFFFSSLSSCFFFFYATRRKFESPPRVSPRLLLCVEAIFFFFLLKAKVFEAYSSSAGGCVCGGPAQPGAALGCLTGRGDSGGSLRGCCRPPRTNTPLFRNTTDEDKSTGETRAPETARHVEKNVETRVLTLRRESPHLRVTPRRRADAQTRVASAESADKRFDSHQTQPFLTFTVIL